MDLFKWKFGIGILFDGIIHALIFANITKPFVPMSIDHNIYSISFLSMKFLYWFQIWIDTYYANENDVIYLEECCQFCWEIIWFLLHLYTFLSLQFVFKVRLHDGRFQYHKNIRISSFYRVFRNRNSHTHLHIRFMYFLLLSSFYNIDF